MSILNVYMSFDRAFVAVDTMTVSHRDGQDPVYGSGQKAMIHGDVVVASRGGLGLPAALNCLLIEANRYWRTDDLLAELKPMLARVTAMHRAALAEYAKLGQVPHAMALEHEIVVVGWSQRLARIEAVVATQTADGWEFEPITNFMAAPAVAGVSRHDLETQVAMKATAARQIAAFKEVDPTAPIGGELIQYDVARDGIIVRKLGAI